MYMCSLHGTEISKLRSLCCNVGTCKWEEYHWKWDLWDLWDVWDVCYYVF